VRRSTSKTRDRRTEARWVPARVGILAAFVLFGTLFGLGGPGLALPESFEGWTETEVAGLRFLNQTEPERSRELISSLIRFREALRVLAPDAVHDAPVPTEVILFANEAAYRPYKQLAGRNTDHLVGHFTATTFGDWIAVNGDISVGGQFRAIFHEATHAFIAHSFPKVPLWLNEGLAEYYSTFRVVGSREEVGHAIEHHLRALESEGMMPLRTLFGIDATSPYYRESERSGRFYAQSWLLVHYLMSVAGDDQSAVERFLAAVAAGVSSETAFRSSLGMSISQVERTLRDYSHRKEYDYWSLAESAAVENPVLRPVSENWVRYRLGTFLALSRPENASAARFRLKSAADGGVADAWASLGYLSENAGQPDDAESFFDRAVAGGARESLSYTLYGRFLLTTSEPGSDRAVWAREMLEQAIALDPAFVEPRALLGSSYLLAPADQTEAGIRQLREAWTRLPGRLDIPFNLAMLLIQTGDTDEADRIIDQIAAVGDRELGVKGRRLVEEARAQRRAQDQTTRFNVAVDLANRRQLEEARTILLGLQSENLSKELKDVVDEMLDRLRTAM
jgi:Flp pilus assembly protein TadD